LAAKIPSVSFSDIPPELRRAEQLHANFLGNRSDFRLNIDGQWLDGTDDNNVHTGQSLLDGVRLWNSRLGSPWRHPER
jgi:hypothetical protein